MQKFFPQKLILKIKHKMFQDHPRVEIVLEQKTESWKNHTKQTYKKSAIRSITLPGVTPVSELQFLP